MLAALQKMTPYYLVRRLELNTFFCIDFGILFDMIQLNTNDNYSLVHYLIITY